MKRLVTIAAAVALTGSLVIGTAASAQPYEYYHHHDANYYHSDGYGHREWHDSDWRRGSYAGFSDWDRARRVDYYRYNLYPPAEGYEWRWVHGDFVLGAVATGLIADVVPGDDW